MPVLDAQFIERALGVVRSTKRQERTVESSECLCCARPQYVGRMVLLCGRKDAFFPFHCMVGPDWPCMLITYALVCVPSVSFLVLVASRLSWVIVVLGLASFLLTLFFFSLTACSDPGIVYRRIVEEEEQQELALGEEVARAEAGVAGSAADMPVPLSTTSATSAFPAAGNGGGPGTPTVAAAGSSAAHHRHDGRTNPATYIPCSRCEMSRPVGASHCYDCEVCVKDLDHHCPWTGKCIGRKNLYFFYLFLTFLTLHIIFVGCVTGMQAVNSAFKLDNNP